MNLVEQYKNRLSVSESIYTKKHEDTAMTMAQKKTVAQVLANTSKFLTEAFGNSVGTQRADMAEFKKFTL